MDQSEKRSCEARAAYIDAAQAYVGRSSRRARLRSKRPLQVEGALYLHEAHRRLGFCDRGASLGAKIRGKPVLSQTGRPSYPGGWKGSIPPPVPLAASGPQTQRSSFPPLGRSPN